jgi:hypothetical protein
LNEFEPVVANELLQIFNEDVNVFNCNIDEVVEPVTKYLKSNELVNCDEPLTVPAGATPPTLPLAAYLISNDEVNCDEELIAPFKFIKNEPVSLSVIQLPLTLSIAFNLFTNDDVDCDAVNVFKFVIDVTKLAVETDAVNVFNCNIDEVTEPVNKYLPSNELVNWDEPLIIPAGAEIILFILLFTEELNATTSPIPKTEPDSEPVIEPLEST